MAEDIRTLSAVLAREPSSLVYVDLAEQLRRAGRRDEALRVAMHGLGRHPQHADGYDCLGRIHADLGQADEAKWAWEKALQIAPEHSGALRGVAFLYFRAGESKKAADALEHALAVDPTDAAAKQALARIRGAGEREAGSGQPTLVPAVEPAAAAAPLPAPRSPASAPASPERAPIFTGLEGANADILLLDARGLVLAGGLLGASGADVSELAAAALAGVSGEASRTAGYLDIGKWSIIVAEAEDANIVLAEVGEGALLLIRRDKSVPVGLALRFAERARGAAADWLSSEGAA